MDLKIIFYNLFFGLYASDYWSDILKGNFWTAFIKMYFKITKGKTLENMLLMI